MTNLKKNLVYNFLLSCSQVLVPLITIPHLSRTLEPAGIGKVGFMDALTIYFVAIAEFGIITYGTRAVARVKHNKAALEKLVSELLFLHLITSAISLLIYAATVTLLWSKIGDVRLLYYSIAFLLINFFSCEWYFRGVEKFKYIAIRALITRGLGVVAIFVLIHEPEDYHIYFAIITLSASANWVLNIIALFSSVKIRFSQLDLKQHLRYVWVTWLISILYSATMLLDTVILRIVSNAVVVGWYVFSTKFVRIAGNVLTDIFQVMFPRTVALLGEGRSEEAQQTILKSAQLVTLLAIPAAGGIYLLADPFVKLFLGDAFLPVADNLRILAFWPFIKAYSLLLSNQVLMPFNKERLFLRNLVIGNIFFVALMLPLASTWGDKGASIAIVITDLIVLVCNYFSVKRTNPSLRIFDTYTLVQAITGTVLFIPVVYLITRNISGPLPVVVASLVFCIPLYFLFQLFVVKNNLVTSLYKNRLQFFNQ